MYGSTSNFIVHQPRDGMTETIRFKERLLKVGLHVLAILAVIALGLGFSSNHLVKIAYEMIC